MYSPNDIQQLMKVKCHGTLAFLHLSPTKMARFGVRNYKLCDCARVCCTQFRLFAGNKVRDEDLPSDEAVVMEIMGTHPTKGYTLYIDQLYSSPAVSIVLLRSVIGTLGLNMKNMPEDMKTHKLHEDETMALYIHKMVSKGGRVKNWFVSCPQFIIKFV